MQFGEDENFSIGIADVLNKRNILLARLNIGIPVDAPRS